MRAFVRVALLLAASVVGGCLIPDRDNPRDPAHRPSPLLLFVDLTTPAGGCPCTIGSSGDMACTGALSGPIVAVSSRGRCLALDARSSGDPDDSTPALDFDFYVDGDRLDSSGDGLVATNGLFQLSRELRNALPLDVQVEFGVRAEDGGGFVGNAEASVIFTNSRPELRSPPTRTFPLFGLPWLRDVPGGAPDLEVEFRAAPFVTDADPSDADHLVYCWSIDGDPEMCSRDEGVFTRSFPHDAPRVIGARVRVSDWPGEPASDAPLHPETFSAPAQTRVTIGHGAIWVHDESSIHGVERMDGAFFDLGAISESPVAADLFVPPGGNPLQVAFSWKVSAGTPRLHLGGFPPATSDPFIPLPSNISVAGIAADGAHERIWVYYQGAATSGAEEPICPPSLVGPDQTTLRGFDATLTERVCVRLPVRLDMPQPLSLAVAGDGTVWVAKVLTRHLFAVGAAPGSSLQTLTLPGPEVYFGLGTRPNSGEVWAMRRSVSIDSPEPGEMSAVRLTSTSDPSGSAFPLDTPFSTPGPWWVDDTRFWVQQPGTGLRLLDIDLVESGANLAGATIRDVPTQEFADFTLNKAVLADPATSYLWARTVDDSAMRVGPNGDVVRFEVDSFQPLFTDPDGALWYQSEAEPNPSTYHRLRRGHSPSPTGVVQRVVALSADSQVARATGGSVWAGGLLTPALFEFGEDGSLLTTVTSYRDDLTGESIAIPAVGRIRLSPDGTQAWVTGFSFTTFQLFGLHRVALDGSGGGRQVMVGTAGLLQMDIAGFFVEPTAPVPGSESFAWTAIDTGSTTEIVRLDDDGFGATLFELPAAEQPGSQGARGAMSQRSNALCLASFDGDTSEAVVRRILPDGTTDELGRYPAGDSPQALAVTHDDAGEWCWATDEVSNVVHGWRADGDDTPEAPDETVGLPANFTAPAITDLYANTPEEVWVGVVEADNEITRVLRYDTGSAGLEVGAQFEGDLSTRFVMPEQSRRR